jgi:hypothetical protein
MARTTISIPDDLKDRMDRVKEDVNWSGIAADAFESKLNDIARKRTEKSMETVIARLRASKIEAGLDLYTLGHKDGIKWASEVAEYAELRRLERFDVVDMVERFHKRTDSVTWAELVAFSVMANDRRRSHTEARGFWANIVDPKHMDERLKSPEFLRGFVHGAVEVYEQVKAAIE